jgi:hypothetical protein
MRLYENGSYLVGPGRQPGRLGPAPIGKPGLQGFTGIAWTAFKGVMTIGALMLLWPGLRGKK